MAVTIGSARIDENGNAHDGAAGDQNGKEVSIQTWYAHSKGWVLLRAKSAEVRERIAACMQAACDNSHIGYDQYQRSTLYDAAKPFNFDVAKVTKNTECDCSSLVRVCCAYAGILVESFRTTNQASVLMVTGAFDKFTDDLHCKKTTNVLRGDILVTKTQGHTVVVLNDGVNADNESGKETILGSRLLKKGMSGSDVQKLQSELIRLGYNLGYYGADGDYGSATAKAVTAFQQDHALEADGIYGSKSHAALLALTTIAPAKQVYLLRDACVRCGNGDSYESIGIASQDNRLEYVVTADNGWLAVVFHNQVGWIPEKDSKVV